MTTVEVDPVASVLAGKRNYTRAVLARRGALDIGEPPFIAHPPTIREQPRNPLLGAIAQTRDDSIEVKPLDRPYRLRVVEVEHRRLNRAARGRARRG
jgi:hypothetical protein